MPGSFDITLRAIRKAKELEIPVQVNTTVTKRTIAELPLMVETLSDLGIVMWSVFIVVPTGRAKASDVVTPHDMEDVFTFLYDTSKTVPFAIHSASGAAECAADDAAAAAIESRPTDRPTTSVSLLLTSRPRSHEHRDAT